MRKRDKTIRFRVTDKEETLIKEKFQQSGLPNYSSFLRKLVLTGHAITLDVKPIDEIASLLRICSNNINQIARKMNSYESIGESDIRYLKELHGELYNMMKELAKKIELL